MKILVTGAGGFIGHHLAKRLKADGHFVRGVDLKHAQYERSACDQFWLVDLRGYSSCQQSCRGMDRVFHLAADMGGIGYLTSQHGRCARNNTLIDINMLDAAKRAGVQRFLFASSACVYPRYRQGEPDAAPLSEEEDMPADPEFGYGWAKLYTEQLLSYYRSDYNLDSRIARFHNVYGPLGCFYGGREKAIAALSRKVYLAHEGDQVEVWGDGHQVRSFIYVDDCVEGLIRLMDTALDPGPVNLGVDDTISIHHLFELICRVAGKQLLPRYDPSKPQGVRGRASDNTKRLEVLRWSPQFTIEQGVTVTYQWIAREIEGRRKRSGDAGRNQGTTAGTVR